MKICLYGYSLVTPGGGTTQYSQALGSALVKAGHEVTIVTRRWSHAVSTVRDLKYDFISIDSGTSTAFRNIQYILKSLLYFLNHRNDYDLIHCMSGFQSFAMLAGCIRRYIKTPMVYSVLSPFRSRFWFAPFDQVICVSQNIEKRFKRSNTIYIPPFIEIEGFKNPTPYHFGKDYDYIVGTMGYPIHRKGIRYLVESIPFILERFPKTLFLLAIDLPAIPYIQSLSQEKLYIDQRIKEKGLEKNIRILGMVNIPQFLHSLQIFVYPVQTTIGMIDIPPTILEGLAAGCGLVTSQQGGISEVVRDRENGLCVSSGESDNPRAYADRIIELIENKSLLERIRRNGPTSVLKFDINNILPQILQVYRKIVKGKGIL